MIKKIGQRTLALESAPALIQWASVAGKREMEGPLSQEFDFVTGDTSFGEKTWEKAESAIQKKAVALALEKAGLQNSDIDYVFAGDLLNQCIASSFGLREFGIPLIGLYGACSTMAESLSLASIFAASGCADRCAAVASSHFCTAERQFRLPLEYGGQRTPTAQWTATAGGCVVVAAPGQGSGPRVRHVTIGKIVDLGVTDANNMGAAMAPAAADTIKTYLEDTGTAPTDYQLILTGDLGQVGSSILYDLLALDQIDIAPVHNDCGLLIYDRQSQDVKAGGSGCGCSASVLCSLILGKFARGELDNILFIATGALLSTTSSAQGESVPGIAHLVHISADRDQPTGKPAARKGGK
ncbi:stage V sporulation protein AD [Bittarella massiliensis (ex Durand et al. 2017)]|uniref:Stage V sporulation protein AD n=1 Tax=Bittarella massiliensis (ex Durand et al. 2017) TaxID=1720313 RepID=A0AAW5KE88_9FIRM|nr:stage V sporulation protein AD [Bittarella massiliensis (ex Durand et al. 2017)]MCQ4949645.1 stage V sporulation protein AD [Bittarella massiliensis (ex Durand et al. 2017)]